MNLVRELERLDFNIVNEFLAVFESMSAKEKAEILIKLSQLQDSPEISPVTSVAPPRDMSRYFVAPDATPGTSHTILPYQFSPVSVNAPDGVEE